MRTSFSGTLRALTLAAIFSLAGLTGCAAEKTAGPEAPADWQEKAPACYRELNGRGEAIRWVRSEHQCRYQSSGQSWGYPGHAENIYRDIFID
ncbi:MAG: hypothetical protein LBV79_11300 [Candidatus Adiutrix sp.]|jgi:hypothetical protein|nr:hypothetical protein [Candidatus Adiutrix sp.]